MGILIFDLVVLIVLIAAAVQGYRRGFVLTLCGFLAIFVAFIGAAILSDALADPVSQAIRPAIEESVSHSLQQSLEEQGFMLPGEDAAAPEGADGSGQAGLGEDFSLEEVLGLLQNSELVQRFSQAIQSAVSDGVLEVTSTAAAAVADYIAREIARMALFLLCFVLVLAGWFVLSHALDLAFKLPVLSALNQWAGAAVGLIKGGVLLFIFCWLFQGLFPQEAVDRSILLHFFCTTNPLALISAIF